MKLSRSIYADRLGEFGDIARSTTEVVERRGRWDAVFRERIGGNFTGRVVFEIGCFDAGYLLRLAGKHPSVAFIGLDWKCKPLFDGAQAIAAAGLRNILLIRGRAQDVAQIFAAGEVDEAWVFHPDPCAGEKELKNRLIAEPFLLDLHPVLRGPGSLVIKTDHPGYYQWMLGLLGLPMPAHFTEPAQPVTQLGPRLHRADLMHIERVPERSAAVLDRYAVRAYSHDLWNDPAVRKQIDGRLFDGETTLFEHRFIRRRFPIYFVEMSRRQVEGSQ